MPCALRTIARQRIERGEIDIALEYNKDGKYWYCWVSKEESIEVCKDSDMGEALHKLAWEIERFMFMEDDQ